jgi:hypothetical protein
MIRTSLTLPVPLHQRLQIVSRQEKKNFSLLVRDLLDFALAKRDDDHLHQMYRGLKNVQGVGKQGITDASTTIDATLYGENGAWKGADA